MVKAAPNERFMVTVNAEPGSLGISLVQHKTEIFVSAVEEGGPFTSTRIPVQKGDKILSINGKKCPGQIKTVKQAEEIMALKPKITMSVIRPDPKRDRGYLWVMKNT